MARNVEFNEEEAVLKAMEVFWEKGYKGTSLRDLTDAMKINSSSLYNTIGDKHALFVKCIKKYTELRMIEVKRLAEIAKSPLEGLVNFINAAVLSITCEANACMAVKTAFEADADDKKVQAILKADNEFTHKFLSSLISKAKAQGELADDDEEPEVLTDYLISVYTGWYELYIIHKDPARIRKMADYLIKQLSR